MLEVRDVLKSYDGRAVVNRVSFEVAPGEIFALLGPNGAGKTTLIRMITDILRPDAGEIRLDGHPVGSVAGDTIAYLPEERGLYRRSRVAEVLAYYGELKGLDPRAAARPRGSSSSGSSFGSGPTSRCRRSPRGCSRSSSSAPR